jgi:AbrB family looped-hinge helix DNA binding protein
MSERQYTSTMTSKGQVTIPAAIRRMLNLEPNATVAFEVKGGEVHIKPARLSLEAIYGAVKPLSTPEDFARIERIAGEERATQITEEDERDRAVH